MYTIEKIAGVSCIFAPMEHATSLTIQVVCKSGSFYEDVDQNGISHCLEHMFFKGGLKYKSAKDVFLNMERLGGDWNAYTSNEYTSYYVKCAPMYYAEAFDVLADMLVYAQFPEEELTKEKEVIIQEIKMHVEDPQEVMMDSYTQWFFGDNSYGKSILGTPESVRSFTREMLFEYKQQLYTKDNLFLVVAGKIQNSEHLKELISHSFQKLPAEKTLQKQEYPQYLPVEHESFIQKTCEQSHLILSAPGFSYMQEEKYPALLLGCILGGNASSRMYQKMREEWGLCYYIGASHRTATDFGIFSVFMGLNKDELDFGVGKLFEEMDKVVKQGVTKEEFDLARQFLIGSLQIGMETSDEMANFLGNQFIYRSDLLTLEEYMEKITKITFEEVRDLCQCFDREHLYLYYIK